MASRVGTASGLSADRPYLVPSQPVDKESRRHIARPHVWEFVLSAVRRRLSTSRYLSWFFRCVIRSVSSCRVFPPLDKNVCPTTSRNTAEKYLTFYALLPLELRGRRRRRQGQLCGLWRPVGGMLMLQAGVRHAWRIRCPRRSRPRRWRVPTAISNRRRQPVKTSGRPATASTPTLAWAALARPPAGVKGSVWVPPRVLPLLPPSERHTPVAG